VDNHILEWPNRIRLQI